MYPRVRLDISWRDLFLAARQCVWCPGNTPHKGAEPPGSLTTLSVRSAFDLLLAALDLPQGSEVLLSEVTVPHMSQIVREHGLVPKPLPIVPTTLQVDIDAATKRIGDQTKLIVIAPLFGTSIDLEPLGQLARRAGALLVEDAAQKYVGGDIAPCTPGVDVTLYSFGPIKTATALGGCVAVVPDGPLRSRMQNIAATWPRQSRCDYLRRVMRFMLMKLVSYRVIYTSLVVFLNLVGANADRVVGKSGRGFADDQLFKQLRQRPCQPLMDLIERRIAGSDANHVDRRTRRGWKLADQLGDDAYVAGIENPSHTFWMFPVVCTDASKVVAELRNAGFDATRYSGLSVVGDTPSEDHWFQRVVFLPHDLHVPESQLERAAAIIRRHSRSPT